MSTVSTLQKPCLVSERSNIIGLTSIPHVAIFFEFSRNLKALGIVFYIKINYNCIVIQGLETGPEQRNKEEHQFMQCQAQMHTPGVQFTEAMKEVLYARIFCQNKKVLASLFVFLRKYSSLVCVCTCLMSKQSSRDFGIPQKQSYFRSF